MSIKKNIAILVSVILFGQIAIAQKAKSHLEHEELGNVSWHRDYDQALELAKKSNKAVLLLFQEIPGCATCRNYGKNVLTHPLMVEAIEELFVPLTIFNNKGGKDKEILQRYGEPSWNNPVVRFVDANGEDLTPRIAGNYTPLNLLRNMKQVLFNSGTVVPEYMNLLEQELAISNPNKVGEAYYQMYCFWTGEKQLGKVDGVINTESGFMGGHEVVKVTYNPDDVSVKQLDKVGNSNKFERVPEKSNYRVASNDVHYYLKNSQYQYLPLSEIQKTKINSALGSNASPNMYLSPKQLQWLASMDSKSGRSASLISTPIQEAWAKFEKRRR